MALRITSVKEIRDWGTCPNLMFGNLLCISISGNFQQPIWVTVANREMLKKDSIVIVQSCWEWNDSNDAQILLNLITAKGLSFELCLLSFSFLKFSVYFKIAKSKHLIYELHNKN